MSKIMQNLFVFMEPSDHAFDTPLKAGKMILNRFCIDEDAAFELSGVNYLKSKSSGMASPSYRKGKAYKLKRKEKGLEFPFLLFYFIVIYII